MPRTLPRIAITIGDPAGVGPEICLRAVRDQTVRQECLPLLFGDANVLRRVAKRCQLEPIEPVMGLSDWHQEIGQLNEPAVVDVGAIDAESVEPGRVTAATGQACFRYLEAAITKAISGEVAAITTGPIHKEALHAAGHHFPGHTEILADRTGARQVCMLLTSPELSCSFVTTHIGYRDVMDALSVARILEVIQLTAAAMQTLRGRSPKLLICGLNPHAGEHGLFGDQEEQRFIQPAIQEARSQGIDIVGPLPPDTAFLPQRRAESDCIVCMYHDQGHIPLKALAFDVAVNVTLGLPIIRTSVDHGTACDIAWQGQASDTSLTQAVLLAAQLAQDRARTTLRRRPRTEATDTARALKTTM